MGQDGKLKKLALISKRVTAICCNPLISVAGTTRFELAISGVTGR